MGDVVELLALGAQEFDAVALTCTCPVCEGPVRWIRCTDQVGRSTRERSLEVACAGRCDWEGTITVTLTDRTARRGRRF